MVKLKLSLEKLKGRDYIHIQALDPKRFRVFGFGNFMLDIQDEEVEITAPARAALLAGRKMNGLQAMEFWRDRKLGWASTNHDFLAPVSAISVSDRAKEWIRQLKG